MGGVTSTKPFRLFYKRYIEIGCLFSVSSSSSLELELSQKNWSELKQSGQTDLDEQNHPTGPFLAD